MRVEEPRIMNLDSIDEMDNTRMSALMVREGRVVSRLTSTVVHQVLHLLFLFLSLRCDSRLYTTNYDVCQRIKASEFYCTHIPFKAPATSSMPSDCSFSISSSEHFACSTIASCNARGDVGGEVKTTARRCVKSAGEVAEASSTHPCRRRSPGARRARSVRTAGRRVAG